MKQETENIFKTKIPDSLKEAVINNNADLWVSFYYNSTTQKLEKYLIVRRCYNGLTHVFYYHPDHLKDIEEDINKFLYDGDENDKD